MDSVAEQSVALQPTCASFPGFEDAPCIAMVERDGAIVALNAIARRVTGLSDGDEMLVHQERVLLGASGLDRGRRVRFECLLVRRHGAPLAVHAVSQQTVFGGRPARLLLMLECSDHLPGTTHRDDSLAEEVLDAMAEAAVITHGGRVLHVNSEFTRLFGFRLPDCAGQELIDLVVPEGRLHEIEMIRHTLSVSGRVAMETRRKTLSGEEIDVCMLIARLRLGGRARGMLVTYRDIRQQKQEEARLKHKARHDALTGLPNRSLFLEQAGLMLARLRRRPDRGFAVFFIDLDGFKRVNDTLGHAAGDALLLTVAGRLKRCLRPQDTVARFGGDEFALLLDESGGEAEVEAVAARLQAEIRQPISIEGNEALVSASIGIALARVAYDSAEGLLQHADSAMYAAKAAGRGRHYTYRWT